MPTCPKRHKRVAVVEYDYGDPFRYDGVSEIYCFTCKKRYGRWTGKVLRGKAKEPPFGNPKLVTDKATTYNA